jgi:hypothetical protein
MLKRIQQDSSIVYAMYREKDLSNNLIIQINRLLTSGAAISLALIYIKKLFFLWLKGCFVVKWCFIYV